MAGENSRLMHIGANLAAVYGTVLREDIDSARRGLTFVVVALAISGLLLGLALILLQGLVLWGLHQRGLRWSSVLLIGAGIDAGVALLLMLGAFLRLRAPLLPRSRRIIQQTLSVLSD